MSVLKVAALAAVAGLALTLPAQAQVSRPNAGSTVITGGPVRVAPTRPTTTVTPGRPTVIERRPVRPDRGHDGDSHLRRRLHNACFSSPNPPSPLCRRVFGDN